MTTAACACGQLTAAVTGDPVRASVCHCLDCKQRTGSAFSWNIRFDRGQVATRGAAREFARTGDERSVITYSFCPDCGVTVWYRNSDMPDMVAIPAGAFAATGQLPPVRSVYDPSRREPWISITAQPLEKIDA
jgi:hypothetical protein